MTSTVKFFKFKQFIIRYCKSSIFHHKITLFITYFIKNLLRYRKQLVIKQFKFNKNNRGTFFIIYVASIL